MGNIQHGPGRGSAHAGYLEDPAPRWRGSLLAAATDDTEREKRDRLDSGDHVV